MSAPSWGPAHPPTSSPNSLSKYLCLYLHISGVLELLNELHGVGKVDADGVNGIFLCQSHRHQVRTQHLMFALDRAELLQNSCQIFLKINNRL